MKLTDWATDFYAVHYKKIIGFAIYIFVFWILPLLFFGNNYLLSVLYTHILAVMIVFILSSIGDALGL